MFQEIKEILKKDRSSISSALLKKDWLSILYALWSLLAIVVGTWLLSNAWGTEINKAQLIITNTSNFEVHGEITNVRYEFKSLAKWGDPLVKTTYLTIDNKEYILSKYLYDLEFLEVGQLVKVSGRDNGIHTIEFNKEISK
ncbi:hypothetical protein [Paenibacillus sp. Leaf72]|uniref:hypothetical protein n=1 Tax=Paenibacillus sp. Leaf72 TaxID=1736234 RepID=UPI0006FAACEE|nr:hypothetical protein [Paenibacillus sp. Leaf72]KQN96919.1 hypothetical protein ASF12_22890 [Paenibacillus sp. Leaf72]